MLQSAARRKLPMVRIEKEYVFEAPNGRRALGDLFEGRRQLIVYHFMFDPAWDQGCPSCSFVVDHFAGALVHLAARDTSLAVIARAPIEKIQHGLDPFINTYNFLDYTPLGRQESGGLPMEWVCHHDKY